ncbi:shieldin complex subunit 1 [Pelodytes ibericus]
MDGNGVTPSLTSESSSVLDLSCTYDISGHVFQPEPSVDMHEDDFSPVLTSGSLEDLGKIVWRRMAWDMEQPDSHNFIKSSMSNNEDGLACDSQILTTLDSFYELSCPKQCSKEENTITDQLSAKISDLHTKNHIYALRSFQMAKIILNRDGTKVLPNCTKDLAFSSSEGAESMMNTKPIPGISEDVISFIINSNKT